MWFLAAFINRIHQTLVNARGLASIELPIFWCNFAFKLWEFKVNPESGKIPNYVEEIKVILIVQDGCLNRVTAFGYVLFFKQ